jgi:hypothetical protein
MNETGSNPDGAKYFSLKPIELFAIGSGAFPLQYRGKGRV